MTGSGTRQPPRKIVYDLKFRRRTFASPKKVFKAQVTIPEPTTVVMLETQRFLFSPNRDVQGSAEHPMG